MPLLSSSEAVAILTFSFFLLMVEPIAILDNIIF